MIRKPPKKVTRIYSCDNCDFKITLKVHKADAHKYPKGWGVIEYEGGGHYGLPIHKHNVCTDCMKQHQQQ